MARTSTYLNFPGQTEDAFNFYRSVFGGEFIGPIVRFGDVPAQPGMPPMDEATKKMIMHMEVAILGGHVLMGTDAPDTLGFKLQMGNSLSLMLEPDSRAEADKLFAALSAGGKVETPLQDMFWGAYFGSFTDKFGVQWMMNCTAKG